MENKIARISFEYFISFFSPHALHCTLYTSKHSSTSGKTPPHVPEQALKISRAGKSIAKNIKIIIKLKLSYPAFPVCSPHMKGTILVPDYVFIGLYCALPWKAGIRLQKCKRKMSFIHSYWQDSWLCILFHNNNDPWLSGIIHPLISPTGALEVMISQILSLVFLWFLGPAFGWGGVNCAQFCLTQSSAGPLLLYKFSEFISTNSLTGQSHLQRLCKFFALTFVRKSVGQFCRGIGSRDKEGGDAYCCKLTFCICLPLLHHPPSCNHLICHPIFWWPACSATK